MQLAIISGVQTSQSLLTGRMSLLKCQGVGTDVLLESVAIAFWWEMGEIGI